MGSGSAGNATVIEVRDGTSTRRLLVDAGFSLRELESRLARAGLTAGDLDAVFVTHEHGDHVGCSVTLARRHGIALWMSRGTWQAIGAPELPECLRLARDGQVITIGALELRPFTVAHDAREPLQLRLSSGVHTLGLLTDVGSITPHLLAHLQGCDALVLECNHDREMLAASRYPASLKARIGGRYGHLSNHTASEILGHCLHGGLQHLVAAHLSEQNNRPDRVRAALGAVCGSARADQIVIADPLHGFDWLALA